MNRIGPEPGERLTSIRRRARTGRAPGSALIAVAAWLLALIGGGVRRMVLAAAPLPALPEAPAPETGEPSCTKKSVLLGLYRAHRTTGTAAQPAGSPPSSPRHVHAIWELSTLAAEWHRTYAGTRADLARALEFYDRWLPGTMRRITDITRACLPHCATLRSPGDWAPRPGYR